MVGSPFIIFDPSEDAAAAQAAVRDAGLKKRTVM